MIRGGDIMALEKVKLSGGKSTGAVSGHPNRWIGRATIKDSAKKRRRAEDKKLQLKEMIIE
jgi:hypothetical protein